jgi:hypothetical protein
MPSSETLERFIARVEQNAHVEAVEEPVECVQPVFPDAITSSSGGSSSSNGWTAHSLTWENSPIGAGKANASREEQFFYDPAQRVPRKR